MIRQGRTLDTVRPVATRHAEEAAEVARGARAATRLAVAAALGFFGCLGLLHHFGAPTTTAPVRSPAQETAPVAHATAPELPATERGLSTPSSGAPSPKATAPQEPAMNASTHSLTEPRRAPGSAVQHQALGPRHEHRAPAAPSASGAPTPPGPR